MAPGDLARGRGEPGGTPPLDRAAYGDTGDAGAAVGGDRGCGRSDRGFGGGVGVRG